MTTTRPHIAMFSGLRIGMQVRQRGEARHVGRIRAIFGNTARIVWEDNGWLSDLDISDDVEIAFPVRWDAELGRHVRD